MIDEKAWISVRGRHRHTGYDMKIAFLNDTVSWYHWGCTGTSMGIRSQLEEFDCDVTFIPVHSTYGFKPVPRSLTDFDDLEFFRQTIHSNGPVFDQLASADLVMVNGEGTIHHLTQPSVILLYIAYVTRKYLNKPVQIINHSPYPVANPQLQELTNHIYAGVYKTLDFAGIREHISQSHMGKLGIQSTLTFDCLPLSLEEEGLLLPKHEKENYIVISNSVSFPRERVEDLVGVLKALSKTGLEPVILTGAKSHPALDEQNFLAWLDEYRNELSWRIVSPDNLVAWYRYIAGARLLISGRFHHSIAAYFQNTPFVLMASNTPKNVALSETLMTDKPIDYSDEKFAESLLGSALEKLDTAYSSDQDLVFNLIERAKLNFSKARKLL